MTRTYSQAAQIRARYVEPLLEQLAARDTCPAVYQHTIFELGQQLGCAILSEIPDHQTNAYLACTAEDADFLARGMLTRLEADLAQVAFTCPWNQRVLPFGMANLAVVR